MDHLPAYWGRLTAQWQSLSARAKVIAVTLILVLLVGIVSLSIQQGVNDWVVLFDGRQLSARELDRMEAAFSTAGLTTWQREGNRIRVPKSEKFTFMAALAESKVLPENSDEVFFETMQSSKFYESSQQRALRIKYATQREAGMIVQSMTGIDSATVRYANVEGKGFGSPITTKINVAVRTTDQHSLSAEQIAAICDTVASTIGADVKDVVVTDLVAAKAYRGDTVNRLDQKSRLREQAQREWESNYRQQISETLAMIDGVVVNVHVQMRPEQPTAPAENTASSQIAPADPTTAVEPQIATPPTTPEPTLLRQGGSISVNADPTYGNQPRSVSDPNAATTEAGSMQVTLAQAPKQIERVTAVVSIPKSHFYNIWRQRCQMTSNLTNANAENAKEALEEIEATTSANVRQLVISCLPGQPDSPNNEQAVLVTSHFDVTTDHTLASTQPMWQAWIVSRWREGIGILGLCIVLFTLTLTVRTAKSSREQKRQAVPPIATREPPLEDAPSIHTDSLRGELENRVRQDPAKAADTLKHWLRDAA